MSEHPIGNSLFSHEEWHAVVEHQRAHMSNQIAGIDSNRLLNTAAADLAKYFSEKYRIDPPHLVESGIQVAQRGVQIDVGRDQRRHTRNRTRPFMISGIAVDVTIPFDGDTQFFRVLQSSCSVG